MEYKASMNAQAEPTSVPVNTDSLEEKLRLLAMKYKDDNTIKLFDIQPDIKILLGLPLKVKAEALCNLLKFNSKKLSDLLDAINRQACWPEQYKFTPWVPHFFHDLTMSTHHTKITFILLLHNSGLYWCY